MMHPHYVRLRFMLAAALLAVLLTACATEATEITSIPPTDTRVPPATTEAAQPEATEMPTESEEAAVTLDLGGVAQRAVAETVPAVEASVEQPWWAVMPQHERVTLEGYPINEHVLKPQIFIYPAEELASWNEEAGKQLADLQDLLTSQRAGERLLASQRVGDDLPFLPLNNAAQVMQARVEFLDFKDGQGIRFLTQYNQGLVPFNNHQLFYTFQGLTNDGEYYVAAVLPVNFPDLPEDELTPLPTDDPFWSDYPGYVSDMVETLNEVPSDAFTPDLAELDAMMASVEVE